MTLSFKEQAQNFHGKEEQKEELNSRHKKTKQGHTRNMCNKKPTIAVEEGNFV